MKCVSYRRSDKRKAFVAKTRYTFRLFTPCQIIYWILLHVLWKCEHMFGYYTKFCCKFRALVGKYTKRFPKCYYMEEPDTPWDPIP